MSEDLKLAVALLVGRNLDEPSACCHVGQICRAEVRKAMGLKGKPISFGHEQIDGTLTDDDRMWLRLVEMGMRQSDYGRVLVVPGQNEMAYMKRQARDEEGILRWRDKVNADAIAKGFKPPL